MSNLKPENKYVQKGIEFYVKIALVFLIIYACYLIFKPFILPIVWGVIISVALYPLHIRLTKILKNKAGLSASVITLVFLAIIIIPSASFTASLVDSIKEVSARITEKSLILPLPSESIEEWPLIGKKAYEAWKAFSGNMIEALQKYEEPLLNIVKKLFSVLESFVGGLLVFIIAIILSGALFAKSARGYTFITTFFTAMAGKKGPEMAENVCDTIRSVVAGVLGTAIIQTAIMTIALFVFKVPHAAIISLIVIFFAITQLPPVAVTLPVVLYMFTILFEIEAVIFAIWVIAGSISDNFIQPVLLGRGVKIPMLVILTGSVGGMLLMGVIGLFIGAVIMSLRYQLFQMWLENAKEVRSKQMGSLRYI